jgi:hypothetical protein
MDLSRLREQTIGSNVDEEAVTVNTRALIDKVLARYSSDWTTLRELIQNAADAQATKVSIRFETLPSKTIPLPSGLDEAALLRHTLQHHSTYRLVVSNNGEPFSDDDWARLKRIAEGNPDETKIGAFGVGFYSVFADCEEPFVISGKKTMAFLWKGNSLFTKSGIVPSEQTHNDTTFFLNYRSTTSPLPDLMSISQFLSTSLTFVGLETIELWLDNWNILNLNKKLATGLDAQIPTGIKTTTKERMMKVVGVVHQSAQLDAKWMNAVAWSLRSSGSDALMQDVDSSGPSLRSLFSRFTTAGSSLHQRKAREAEAEAQRIIAEHITESSTATIFLRVSTVNVQTHVNTTFAKELERATKKPPPKHTRIAILTSGHEEANASFAGSSGLTASKGTELFDQVLPTKIGRIFIGFPTAQTTGMLCHISAPSVIPTVERENIDLSARYVKTWNIEMLRVAGIGCRIAYAGEMNDIKQAISRSVTAQNRNSITTADVDAVIPRTTHVFKQYTTRESTPSSQVGVVIEEAFWECSTNTHIEILSSTGILPSNRVRIVAEPLSFLGTIPIVPPSLATAAEEFVKKLYVRGLISDMSIKDIRTELEAKSLDESQFMEFLKWASNQLKSCDLDPNTVQSLLQSAVVTLDEKSGSGRIIALSQIKTFLSGSKIPPDMPVPPYTIPFKFSKVISRQHLESFGWEELQIVPWIHFLIEGTASGELSSKQDIQKTPEFATSVLMILSKQWESLSQNSRNTLIELFSDRTIIPTKLGMRRPTESYFATVKLFDDLPTIDVTGVKEKVLLALGVRKTIELNYVFDRLMSQSSKTGSEDAITWSFVDLIHYLASVRNDIPSKDIERLRSTAICPKEETMQPKQASSRLYKISKLFEPKDSHRDMGLPIVFWPGIYRFSSPEGKFLNFLGLKQYPSMLELVQIMTNAISQNDQKRYDTAMRYFQENYIANNYARSDLSEIRSIPFLPVEGKNFPNAYPPNNCYQNERAAIMGYPVLRADLKPYAMRFGVAIDPPIQDVVIRLVNNPPSSDRTAIEIFGYFAGRLAELTGPLADVVGNAKIVPITNKSEKQTVRLASPRSCYLGDPSTYGEIFDFVNFGNEANSFLFRVGSKEEPNSIELAQQIVEGPARLLGLLGDKKFLELLRKLAENVNRLRSEKILWKELKQRPCLLAYKESFAQTPPMKRRDSELIDLDDYAQEDEDTTVRHSLLRRASEIVIHDAPREYQMFREVLATAPQDDMLESFYQSLGVPLLSSLVKKETNLGSLRRDQTDAQKMRKHIIERARLFIYEHGQDIRHDAKWLEKHLFVSLIDSIVVTQSLQGYAVRPFREKKTAAIEAGKGKDILYIVKDPDLYEVAYWIAGQLLNRRKQNDILALEMVLSSDLRRLRSKGYNVDRILRQKEYETRLAEEERKKQAAEEEKLRSEQKRLFEKETNLAPPPPYEVATPARDKQPTTNGQHATPIGTNMPGSFFDSPQELENNHTLSGTGENPFQNFLSSAPEWARQIGDRIRGNTIASHPTQPSLPSSQGNPVTSERNIAQNLVNAVNACRSHNSSSLFSKPTTTNVEEAKGSYCDSTPAQDMNFLADTATGIKFFIANHISARSEFFTAHATGINTFCNLLLDIASVFNMRPQSMHVFYDNRGATIAFNESGALFFNYHWFEQLHLQHFETSRDVRIHAVSWWWITMCHELAHNLVKEHSASHSFYTESFVQQYFMKVMAKILQY